ncbi:hypothetical protein [uncultured Pleomorphomonas sp.]|nr:hypothetical protein [uncultured Pleomorphomonas sp.]
MEPDDIGKSDRYARSVRAAGILTGFDKLGAEARHQHDVAVFPAEKRRPAHHALANKAARLIERYRPPIVGKSRKFDPMEIQPFRSGDRHIEGSSQKTENKAR